MIAQAGFVLTAVSVAMMGWFSYQQKQQEVDMAERSASHLAAVAQAAAGRMFEMGENFITAPGYNGTPPGPGDRLLWLKNPNTCTGVSGIPALPEKENGEPVQNSFLPCDFEDTNPLGLQYRISWDLTYPHTQMIVRVREAGSDEFLINGQRRDEIAGMIASRAYRHSHAGLGEGTQDVMISYRYDPDLNELTATIDRTASAMADAFLRIDGENEMDAAAPIRWGNGMSITPDTDDMVLAAPGSLFIRNDTTVEGELTMDDGLVTDLTINGGHARLSQGVYHYSVVNSGQYINKPSCPSGSTPHVHVTFASIPVGDGMSMTLLSGTRNGDVKRVRARAVDASGNRWQVLAEAYITNGGAATGSWYTLGGDDGWLRSAVKCAPV